MRKLPIVIVGLVAATRLASAQAPTPSPAPTEPDAALPGENPGLPPAPMPVPGPTPVIAAPPPAPPAEDVRPNELVFGIGLGYILPTSLETPNVTSVRVRFPSGIILEPRLALANSTSTQNVGGADVSTSTNELGVGTLFRYPVIHHHRVDFELVGLANIDSTTTNPDGDNNNSSTMTFTLGWGVGVQYWIARHWQFSLTATNPLVSITSTEMDGTPNNTTQTTKSFGLIFSPTVAMMIHVYN